ncbi:hypothetical protein HZ326_6410 [Fusarium oxysporum f. sp. albedinis]|nr:hypothetical protein HZ326_6410 [Fusarium oxysporum f. sp. albedinis]
MGHLHDETDTLFPLCKTNHWISKVFSRMLDLLPIFNPTHPQLTCRVPLPEKAIQHQQHNLPSFTVNDLVVFHTKRPAFSPHAKSCAAIYVVHMS